MIKKKYNNLPYRFTSPIPCEVVGHREISEEEKKSAMLRSSDPVASVELT